MEVIQMKNKIRRNNITISLDKFGQAKYLNDCILHEISNGNNRITVNITESFSGSNVCAPIAGIIDYHRSNGILIHVNCPPNSYAKYLQRNGKNSFRYSRFYWER